MPQMSDEEMMEAVMGSTGELCYTKVVCLCAICVPMLLLMTLLLVMPQSVPLPTQPLLLPLPFCTGPRKVAAGKVRRKRNGQALAELAAAAAK